MPLTTRPSAGQRDCDLVVVGSGAGGLSAAVAAAVLGLDVIVLEKAPVYGGTTAWSGGWMWIPRNPLAAEAGIREDLDGPRTYLRHELGEGYDAPRVDAFLAQGPRMVDFFRAHTAVAFVDGNAVPDFHGHAPGACEGGRSVGAASFDARALGPALERLRPPSDVMSLAGMGIASGTDLRHFMNATYRWDAFLHVARRVTRHLIDLTRHGRGMHLVGGNALVARLAKSALDRGVEIVVDCPAQRLRVEDGRVTGVVARGPGGEVDVRARRGVVLACGGFPHDVVRRRALFPHVPTGAEHWSAAPATNTGDGLRLGESAGGRVDASQPSAVAWAPVSRVPRRDGSHGHFAHLVERGKPGVIAVRRDGRRFVNEADSYHDFMSALVAATADGEPVRAWLVCDHRFLRHYGLGHVKPRPLPLRAALRSGYLKRGRTLAALAQACGIDAAALETTVERYNAGARDGRDPQFHRGETAFNRQQGDPFHGPNPCVAPIERAPFYAVEIVPGSLGTFAGLRTDARAHVLDAGGAPIPGLYACGTDMSSVMAGRYPSGGINLGPAMTFGYIAAHDAAGVALDA